MAINWKAPASIHKRINIGNSDSDKPKSKPEEEGTLAKCVRAFRLMPHNWQNIRYISVGPEAGLGKRTLNKLDIEELGEPPTDTEL